MATQRESNSSEVQLFDSLVASKDVGRLIVLQAACLYKKYSQTGNLRRQYMPSQQQDGIVDCGLFAIAFAVEFSQGRRPGKATFEQKKMRKHLHQCLMQGP